MVVEFPHTINFLPSRVAIDSELIPLMALRNTVRKSCRSFGAVLEQFLFIWEVKSSQTKYSPIYLVRERSKLVGVV